MQGFLTLRSVAKPFSVHQGGSTASTVTVDSLSTPVWSDGTVDAPYAATKPLGAISLYGGSTIDTSAFIWLLLALKGITQPVLLKEADFATVDTVLTSAGYSGATWGLLARIDGASIEKVPQV